MKEWRQLTNASKFWICFTLIILVLSDVFFSMNQFIPMMLSTTAGFIGLAYCYSRIKKELKK